MAKKIQNDENKRKNARMGKKVVDTTIAVTIKKKIGTPTNLHPSL